MVAQVKVEGGHCKEEMILTDNTAYDISQKHMSTFHPLPQDNPAHMYDTVPARQETIYERINYKQNASCIYSLSTAT